MVRRLAATAPQHSGGRNGGGVVVGVGHLDQHRAGLDSLEEQRAEIGICIQQSRRAAAVPQAERGDLVARFSDVATDLEHRVCPVSAPARGNVIDADVWKAAIDSNAPAPGECLHQLRQRLQPVRIVLVGADEVGREIQHKTSRHVPGTCDRNAGRA